MILVTGAGGQLGTALTFLLEKQGQKYEALGRGDLDITNFARVVESTKVLKPRLVINCAAYNDVDAAETHWQDASNVNGLGVRNLAVACAEGKGPLVHVSTDFVFDGTKSEPYTIADKPHPINAYGKSKLFGETLLRSLTDRYYLVRTSWVFGRGTNNFMTKLFSWAANNDTLRNMRDAQPLYRKSCCKQAPICLSTPSFSTHIQPTGICCTALDYGNGTARKHQSLPMPTRLWQDRLQP